MVLQTRNKIASARVREEIPNAYLRTAIDEATQEYRRGETVGFDNVKDAIHHLHSQCWNA